MLLGNLETVYATSVCIFNRTVVTLSSRKTSTLPWEMNSKDFLPLTLIHTIRLSIHNLTFTYSEDRVQYLVQECFNVQTREASDRTTDLLMGRCSTSWGRAAQTWEQSAFSNLWAQFPAGTDTRWSLKDYERTSIPSSSTHLILGCRGAGAYPSYHSTPWTGHLSVAGP